MSELGNSASAHKIQDFVFCGDTNIHDKVVGPRHKPNLTKRVVCSTMKTPTFTEPGSDIRNRALNIFGLRLSNAVVE